MPVQDSRSIESSKNSAIELEGSRLQIQDQSSVTNSFDDETTINDEESTSTDSSSEKPLDIEGDNDKDTLIKRSIEGESNDDDLETAAGTNALRPLFVYRQQVAYRQRIRNANRRGYRRF